jgi:hypothetical protein
MNKQEAKHLRIIRIWLGLFMVGLALSGITAFPLETELNWLANTFDDPTSKLAQWIDTCRDGVVYVNAEYPFLSYGTDWLAFAHLVLALVFVGPWMDPVKNIWVIRFGIMACFGVFPLAFIMGSIRSIPFYWQLIDCSFGILGSIPLFISLYHTKQLEVNQQT